MTEEAQIRELVNKMTAERARLLAALESLSEEEAATPPKPGEWNAKQQMAHLCEMETAYRTWVRRALEEDGAIVDNVRPDPPAIPLERANDYTVAELVAEMRRQREETTALIRSMQPADFDRKATNAIFGTLTVMQWLRSYYRHDRMHLDQISGREPQYKPRFRSGVEPDQRRGTA